jgi:hypothetical protein
MNKKNLHRLFLPIIILMFMLIEKSWAQTTTTVFSDNYNRGAAVTPLSAGGVPSATYSTNTTATGTGSGATSRTNLTTGTDYAGQILIGDAFAPNTQTLGVTSVAAPLSSFSAPFSATLNTNPGDVTWTFHMRHNRSTFPLSGFSTTGNY